MTAATILLAVPTVITSAYGMNIDLPLQQYKHAFAVLAALSCVLAAGIIGVLFYLYKKRVF
jgi:magnesium transporter